MTSPARSEAARKNGAKSKGPSEAAKARTRFNALKHGMAAKIPEAEAKLSAEFQERRQAWAAEYKPVGEVANWELDNAVAASLRHDRCGRAFEEAIAAGKVRAELAWAEDRALEAARVASRLARDPAVAARQLRTTLDGVDLLLEGWRALGSVLEIGDWDQAQCSRALDLLGVDPANRSGRTAIDPIDTDPIEHRKALVNEEVEQLEQLLDEVMAPLDELDRTRAISGESAMLSKEARLIQRYEKDAWRRHRQSVAALRARNEPKPESNLLPKPIALPTLKPIEPPSAPPKPAPKPERTFEQDRESLLAEAAPYLHMAKQFREMGLIPAMPSVDPEDAWLDAFEARLDAAPDRPGNFVRVAAGVAPG